MDLRFDFSPVLKKNLRSGDGMTAPLLREGRRAEKAALAVARRHASGETGFPDLPPAEIRIRGDA